MVRAVVDTNVIVSGAIKQGNPRKIWVAFESGNCIFVLSPFMLRELTEVLGRPKFHKLINTEGRKRLIAYLRLFAEFINPSQTVTACRDAEDNHILSCAKEAKVDFLVTGDNDLLVLKSFQGIPILTPKEFLPRLNK